MNEALEKQLIEELAVFGIELSVDQARTLVSYLMLVIEKNKVVNLTRITNPADAVTLHLVDSLIPLASSTFHIGEKDHVLVAIIHQPVDGEVDDKEDEDEDQA